MNNKKATHNKASSKKLTVEQTTIRQSPIPSPEDMLEYNKAIPGAADRILKMAEDERRDRNRREDRRDEIVSQSDKREFISKILALIISLIAIVCFLSLSYFALTLGYPTQAVGFIGVSLVGVIGYLMSKKKSVK
ncbi:DUF2335 domain-containing protein [Tenacibaculum finnmarkense genomovar ulcerans]|uniref:DUF2335 domain-containing protein n=1 Tax=Tenacibaculum finnmarkense TaxID=2781243 RepID=UPI00187B5027|nr:DUF2335 domain-containing protein [Tenacibaculum finnmarkense]MBE7645531.1 DUF2335 domain-containing protein [Tenacibaculum finnmarkense genomovar ulcerans]